MNHLAAEFRSELLGEGRITGHAAVFGRFARIGDHLETITPGAFDRALQERHDVLLTVGHDDDKVLARTKAGTLQLRTDAVGLAFEAVLPDTTLGRDVRTSVTRGDIDSMSFAFTIRADQWTRGDDGHRIHSITDLDLYDVSIVGRPAYDGTDVRLRHRDAYVLDPAPGHRPRLIRAKARLLLTGV